MVVSLGFLEVVALSLSIRSLSASFFLNLIISGSTPIRVSLFSCREASVSFVLLKSGRRWRYRVSVCPLSKAVSNETRLVALDCFSLVSLVPDCLSDVSVERVCLLFWADLVWIRIFFFRFTGVLFMFVVIVA